jgi:hypothetical protein
LLGWTTPSVSGVPDVIGGTASDSAFNVHFDDNGVEDAWFAPELAEFVDLAPGTTISVGDRQIVRGSGGEWTEAGDRRKRWNLFRRTTNRESRG